MWCPACRPEAHKNAQREYNKEYYAKNREVLLADARAYGAEHKTEGAEYNAGYHASHREEQNSAFRIRRLSHLDEERANHLSWRLAHPGVSAAATKQWRQDNPMRARASEKNWRLENPEKTKEMALRHTHKRRNLGFVLLNAPFAGSEGHHVDPEQVINMPKALHRSIYHRQDTGQGMAKINAIAYNFLFKQEVETAMMRIKEANRGEA